MPLTQNMCSVVILSGFSMDLVTTVRLDPEGPPQLLALIEHFNRACNELSRLAFESKTFGWLALQLSGKHEAKLIYRRGKFVLYQVYERPEGDEQEANDWLGCDLGIVNILAAAMRRNFPERRSTSSGGSMPTACATCN
jgi:hypothetical protein